MNIKTIKLYSAIIVVFVFTNTQIIVSSFAQEKTHTFSKLIHTKLDVRFDYKKRYLYGKEWVTIKQYEQPSDSLLLDAKGMEIHTLSIIKKKKKIPLKYSYDQRILKIKLDRVYNNKESYTIFINYIAKPDELKLKAGKVILNDKGLFFINPDSLVKDKPVQIWTQSALENASVWFPTIDKPNQKTTSEISITVPSKYVTLSNGKLSSQIKNTDSSRTDTWRMELPHSPYLFMMAVGDFKILKDKWRDKEVSYYLEPKYAAYAKDIFGVTPEMMEFFSRILGVDFPWNKYSQIIVRDFVSGGMENTSATLYISHVQRTKKELADIDYDLGKSIIAHELFHQWFGDYVTTTDWANATVNESFADLGETLWAEYKYGQDAGDYHNNIALQDYLRDPLSTKKDLVRFNYDDAQDVFDEVSYQKGGRILNMLRNYLTAPVFYNGLKIYLKANAFKNGDAMKVRTAMEKASGKDLEWFFKQWYYGAGHPILDINYEWDNKLKTQTIFIKQTQEGKPFILPVAIDLYINGNKERKNIWLRNKDEKLVYKLSSKPNLVNVDGDKIILAKKADHKNLEEFLFQYKNAHLYMDRYEAIESAIFAQDDIRAQEIIIAALGDKFYGLRLKAVEAVDLNITALADKALPVILKLAENDINNSVRAAAITKLSKTIDADKYYSLYKTGLKNKSYAIAAASLKATSMLNPAYALEFAKSVQNETGGNLTEAVITVYAKYGGEKEWHFANEYFRAADLQNQFALLKDFTNMVARMSNSNYVQQGINTLKNLAMDTRQFGTGPEIIESLNSIKQVRHEINDSESADMADLAIKEINTP